MTWNAEKMAYVDCFVCNGTSIVDIDFLAVSCDACLKRRIAELEAALRPFASIGALEITDEELENLESKTYFPVYMLRRAARVLAKVEGSEVADESDTDS